MSLRASSPHHLDNHLVGIDTGLGKRSTNIDLERDGDVKKLLELAPMAADVVMLILASRVARRPRTLGGGHRRAQSRCHLRFDLGFRFGRPLGDARRIRSRRAGRERYLAIADGSRRENPRLSPVVTLND